MLVFPILFVREYLLPLTQNNQRLRPAGRTRRSRKNATANVGQGRAAQSMSDDTGDARRARGQRLLEPLRQGQRDQAARAVQRAFRRRYMPEPNAVSLDPVPRGRAVSLSKREYDVRTVMQLYARADGATMRVPHTRRPLTRPQLRAVLYAFAAEVLGGDLRLPTLAYAAGADAEASELARDMLAAGLMPAHDPQTMVLILHACRDLLALEGQPLAGSTRMLAAYDAALDRALKRFPVRGADLTDMGDITRALQELPTPQSKLVALLVLFDTCVSRHVRQRYAPAA